MQLLWVLSRLVPVCQDAKAALSWPRRSERMAEGAQANHGTRFQDTLANRLARF